MSTRTLSVVLACIVATVLGTTGISLAAQAECDDPIENVAKIGWPSRLTLSITEDDDEHECRFSIEGVAAGSPPESELQAAIQQLRQFPEFGGSQFSTRNQPNATLSGIPLLLSAASPRDAVEDELTTEAFQANLTRCLTLISSEYLPMDGGPAVVMIPGEKVGANLSEFGAQCAVATPNALDELNGFLGGGVRIISADTPLFVLKNEREGTLTEYLILPIARMQ